MIMDIRIEKTKTAIHNTFLELRSKKPLEKITIKEYALHKIADTPINAGEK